MKNDRALLRDIMNPNRNNQFSECIMELLSIVRASNILNMLTSHKQGIGLDFES